MEKLEILKRFFTLTGWGQFLRILDKKEKIIFLSFFTTALLSGVFLLVNFYFENTKIVPAQGGKFIEGVIGYPRFINPIYAEISDTDRDLTELIFSGLMKYTKEGEIVPDLAKNYKILEEGKVYEFEIRENAFWHDGKKVTSDDIIFTIETIKNPEIKSPLFPNWVGVEVEKIDDLKIKFRLKEPYSGFLERTTVKIIPQHIWKDVLPKNFPLVMYNLMPIGSGPYQFKELFRDEKGEISSLELMANKKYFDKQPNISQIVFKFFDSEEKLKKALQKGEVHAAKVKINKEDTQFQEYRLVLLRYFAVFFNPKNSKALAEKEVRQALNYATNKREILEKVLNNQGQIINSPLLPELYGFKTPSITYEFNLEKAKEILEKSGYLEKEGKRIKIIKKQPVFQFKSDLKEGALGKEVEELQKCLARDKEVYPLGKIDGNFDSLTKKAVIRFQEKYKIERERGKVLRKTREKLNELCFKIEEEIIPLKFSLITLENPLLKETALLLKEQWKKIGAEVEVKTLDFKNLETEIIKPRNYEALLFGQVLGKIPDPFPFWHSSQREFGLNLANYKNKKADEILEIGRKELVEENRAQKYEEWQEILMEDAPAVFLYNPDYFYFVSKKIKGIERKEKKAIVDPSKRFSGIEDWYIKTKRILK